MTEPLAAPFPWFGGKRRVAPEVWARFGNVQNYVEPFFGSGAVLLGRPASHAPFATETVNDLDGFVCNFWRAVKADPEATARWADNPVNENDLHARHIWLVGKRETLRARLEGDPEYFDAKIAGWWAWGLCCWIGGGWCSGQGPWSANAEGMLVSCGDGVISRQLPHLGDAGQGVNSDAAADLAAWFAALSARLARVRVCSGDWSRICGPSVTHKHGLTAVFLDPPYGDATEMSEVYHHDSGSVSTEVREWAIEAGRNPLMRVALCGYEGEHRMPDNWTVFAWKANGGYSGAGRNGDNGNSRRERIWFSPACLAPHNDLFGDLAQ